jgi:hypothetical protein
VYQKERGERAEKGKKKREGDGEHARKGEGETSPFSSPNFRRHNFL